MTENYTGTSADVTVNATSTALLASPLTAHDAILVTNQTEGTVVWCDDNTGVASGSPWPVRYGETVELPFTGQAYALARATTDAGEALNGATVEVRPITVDSPLQRSLWSQIAVLISSLISKVRVATPDDLAFERDVVRETDLTVANGGAFEVFTGPVADITGRTLEVRQARRPGNVIDWIDATAVNAGEWNQAIRIELTDMPAGTYDVDVVAVLGSDEIAVVRGRLRGI